MAGAAGCPRRAADGQRVCPCHTCAPVGDARYPRRSCFAFLGRDRQNRTLLTLCLADGQDYKVKFSMPHRADYTPKAAAPRPRPCSVEMAASRFLGTANAEDIALAVKFCALRLMMMPLVISRLQKIATAQKHAKGFRAPRRISAIPGQVVDSSPIYGGHGLSRRRLKYALRQASGRSTPPVPTLFRLAGLLDQMRAISPTRHGIAGIRTRRQGYR